MTVSAAQGAAPRVTHGILASLVRRELERKLQRLLLVHATLPADAATEFAVTVGDVRYQVTVADCGSVLAIVDAWDRFTTSSVSNGVRHVLVVTTAVPDDEIGLSLRAFAAHRATITVDRSALVCEQFGVRELDWRVVQEPWLLDALLTAEPTSGWAAEGWKPSGPLLTRDTAVAALLDTRVGLGTGERDGGPPDIGMLLDWSRGSGPARYAALPEAERTGMREWLAEATGPVAPIVLRMAEAGRAAEAVPLGLLCGLLDDQVGGADALLLVGSLFGPGVPATGDLRSFADATAGAVLRWIHAAEGNGDRARDRRELVLAVVNRAEALAAGYPRLAYATRASDTLPAGFTGRLLVIANVLIAADHPSYDVPTEARRALDALIAHRLAPLFPARVAVAEMALRLARWLHDPSEPGPGVPANLAAHVGVLGWVDRAMATVRYGDPETGTDLDANERIAAAYRTVHELARARRHDLDRRFAVMLAASGTDEHAGGALPIENVLERVAVPLADAARRAPLILVLDGMSSAVATELGEQATRRAAWTEIAPSSDAPARLAALAVVPSVTTFSRASLLTGALTEGGQRAEKDGFSAFWRRARRDAVLVHKSEIGDDLAGGRLAPRLTEALAGDGVVGVVLNDVDDALDKGARGDQAHWELEHVRHLQILLDAARGYGRPVVLVSDHGHVLDRYTERELPVRTGSSYESQRYRSADGEPAAAGEVMLTGRRVLDCAGSLIAAWDEDLRYTARRAGYHGGAALAEMTVPILVLLPAGRRVPVGWLELTSRRTTPSWWTGTVERPGMPSAVAPEPEAEAPVAATATPSAGLGAAVAASEIYGEQRRFVRKMKDADVITAIDALSASDGTLPAVVLADVLGRPGPAFDGFVANLERLLNVDQYPVISRVDAGRTIRLDTDLLRLQFGLDRP